MKNILRKLFSFPRQTVATPPAPERKSFSLPAFFAFTEKSGWREGDYAAYAREGYRMNPVVYACIRMIADGAARIPARIMLRGDIVKDHPIAELLSAPNPAQDGTEFFRDLYGQFLTDGNAYVHFLTLNENVRELHLLRPDRVRMSADPRNRVAYEYGAGEKTRKFSRDEVARIKLFAPDSDDQGVSPFSAAARAIEIHNEATLFQKSLLENAARPSGCLIYGGATGGGANLTCEQFERLKAELRESYTGSAKAGAPMVLEGGLDWKSMSFSPADMEFSQLRHGAAREIALAFGVPPMLLGIPGDNHYANYQEAARVFARQTLLPTAETVFSGIARGYARITGEKISLAPDLESLPAFLPEREAFWNRIAAADFLTPEEKRRHLGL